eukprot:TRINITY_DN23555_c0_g1_i1.p1 TRINITY_DN23555_c0_g1~~TRINITY_DN23555_c0_g1_i1.p1  ORF type:complete len:341 (+),score=99.58 TRINITY_DN23555_c0_g1_i1:138-1160(+)
MKFLQKIMQALKRIIESFHHEITSPCFDRHSIDVCEYRSVMSCEGDLGDLEEFLPPEMQMYILSFFSIRELVPLFRVSKKMNFLASCNCLWHRFVLDDVADYVLPALNFGDIAVPNKELYRLFATVWKWDHKKERKAPGIEISDWGSTACRQPNGVRAAVPATMTNVADTGRTAHRSTPNGSNPAVLTTMPFTRRRNTFEVKVNARGGWLGIGVADRKFRLIDGSTLGKQRNCVNSAFFCQDTTVLQMEGARRTHVEKTIAHRIEVGDRIRVKVDLPNNAISYFRNGALVGTLRSERSLSDVDLYPCVNLSQGSSLSLLHPSADAAQHYILAHGRLPPTN